MKIVHGWEEAVNDQRDQGGLVPRVGRPECSGVPSAEDSWHYVVQMPANEKTNPTPHPTPHGQGGPGSQPCMDLSTLYRNPHSLPKPAASFPQPTREVQGRSLLPGLQRAGHAPRDMLWLDKW